MNTNIDFGRGVELLRIHHGVSKKELALATGIDEGNLNRIISGKQWPTQPRLLALMDFFGVPASEIFRVAEQGAIYQVKREDPRKTAMKAMIDEMDSNKLDNIFRLETVITPPPPPSLPDPNKTKPPRNPEKSNHRNAP